MSRQTLAAIEDALQAHIAQNDGGTIWRCDEMEGDDDDNA